MKYRLRDREKDAAIRKLISSDLLDADIEKQFGMGHQYFLLYLNFSKDEIEGVPDYNPKSWNPFPEVIPPEGVWMRITTHKGNPEVGYWNGERWMNKKGPLEDPSCLLVKTFRPWEEKD